MEIILPQRRNIKAIPITWHVARRDLTVVTTLRCGRSNLGSNPSHGRASVLHVASDFFFFNTVMVYTGFSNMWPPILSQNKIIKVYSQDKMHKSLMNSYLMWNNHQDQDIQNFLSTKYGRYALIHGWSTLICFPGNAYPSPATLNGWVCPFLNSPEWL